MADDNATIEVEVIYAGREAVWSCQLALEPSATVADALVASRVRILRPDVQVGDDNLGIFGRRVSPQQTLHAGDRVEIYRRLELDPMQARRRRARTAD